MQDIWFDQCKDGSRLRETIRDKLLFYVYGVLLLLWSWTISKHMYRRIWRGL